MTERSSSHRLIDLASGLSPHYSEAANPESHGMSAGRLKSALQGRCKRRLRAQEWRRFSVSASRLPIAHHVTTQTGTSHTGWRQPQPQEKAREHRCPGSRGGRRGADAPGRSLDVLRALRKWEFRRSARGPRGCCSTSRFRIFAGGGCSRTETDRCPSAPLPAAPGRCGRGGDCSAAGPSHHRWRLQHFEHHVSCAETMRGDAARPSRPPERRGRGRCEDAL